MLGALIALWPSPEARRRRVTSLYAARLGRELTARVAWSPPRVLALLVLLALVAWSWCRPLLRSRRETAPRRERRAALQAAKEAKYREIHDAELDFRMGKLSEADYRALDRELRAQAIEILQASSTRSSERDAR